MILLVTANYLDRRWTTTTKTRPGTEVRYSGRTDADILVPYMPQTLALNFWRRNYFFFSILAHSVYKM